MKEELLQFIWRWQYFNQHELLSETGEALQVLAPGELNTHQGPDFLNAQVRIGDMLLAGSVELHTVASDWDRHAHTGDMHYRNVILHVVWENDLGPGTAIPMLVLQHRVPKLLLGQYERWMKGQGFIPCERVIATVGEEVWREWKQRLLLQRLQRRALLIRSWLEENRQHWEETTWWLLARNFGLTVNGSAFEAIGRSLPIRLLARHRGDTFGLQALLLGQAGLLDKEYPGLPEEGFPALLQKEYGYLQKKYRLVPIQTPPRFLRMRPAHFPTVRLAQLAALLSGHTGWFAAILEADEPGDLGDWLRVEAGGKKLGQIMKNSLLINTFVPLLYAYGWLRGEPACQEKALRWLREARPESNAVLTGWMRLGVVNKNAADSQALLELKSGYCDPKKCLDCAIGKVLLGATQE
jgi:hypothetical protein